MLKRKQGQRGWDRLSSQVAAKKYLSRRNSPRSQEVLPGIHSFDGRYLLATEALHSRLSKAAVLDEQPGGVAGANGIPGDWSTLLSVSGMGMDPLPIPLQDNGTLRESYGLAADGGFASPDDEALFHELLDEMFGYHAPAALAIRKPATTGFPYFTSDPEYKLTAVRKALSTLTLYLRMQMANPGEALDTYDSAMAYAIFERQQADSSVVRGDGSVVPKERLSPDEEYVRSFGEAGYLRPCDKSVVIEGRSYAGHAAMRRRPVFGMSFVPNHVVSAVFSCMRSVYLDRFEFTWKHRSAAHMSEKLVGVHHLVGCDVKNMDNTIPRFAIRAMCAGLRRHLRGDFVDMLEAMYFAPFAMSNPFRDGRTFNHFFGGDPLDPKTWENFPGLPSGISSNPDTGKFWMTFVYIVAARACGAVIPKGSVARFLRGELAVKLLDMSDDAVIGFESEEQVAAFKAYESPYMKLGVESPAAMLGSVAIREGGAIKFVPNIITYVTNFYVPERGIQHPSRSANWALGFNEREAHYSTAPMYKEVREITEATISEFFGIKPSTLASIDRMRRENIDDTSVDAQLLANPHYLHYRIDPRDVKETTLAQLASVIPADENYKYVQQIFLRSAQA